MSNKYGYGSKSIFDIGNGDKTLIVIGRVVSISDEFDGGRIKARVEGVDDTNSDSELPYSFPLIPKHLGIMPKVGESVLIFKSSLENDKENRLWVGPIISQPHKLNNDPHFFSSTATKDGGVIEPEQAPSTLPNAKGIYPDKKYISIQGRNNNDIIFKDNELLIRNGKHLVDDNLTFNKESISYIKIKNNVLIDTEEEILGGATTIVSDKINLISHSGNRNFNITNQDDLITDEELLRIIENASPLVYGDKLNELLELVKEFINNHTHAYPGLPPVKTKLEEDILNYNLNDLISNNIRIN